MSARCVRASRHLRESRVTCFERFLQATFSGDLDGLVALLSSDVVLHSDGGGKAIAVPNVIHGVDNVARGILGALRKLLPKDLVRCISEINGAPGVVTYLNGKPFSVLTFDAVEDAFGRSTS